MNSLSGLRIQYEEKFIFLEGFYSLPEIMGILDKYTLDEIQLFIPDINGQLWDALDEYLLNRIKTAWLSR